MKPRALVTRDVGQDMVFSPDVKDSHFHLPPCLFIIYSEVQRHPKIGNILAMKVEGRAYVLEAVVENPQSSGLFFLLQVSLFFLRRRFD